MSFDVLVNGAGDAFSRRDYGTNFLLRHDEFVLGIDCPDGYRSALAEHAFEHDGEPLEAEDLDALVVTHLHGDHVNGLEMLLAYYRHVLGDRLDLFVAPEVAEDLWERRLGVALGQVWNGESFDSLSPEDYYCLHEIPWEEPMSVGPFEIETRKTIHHLPATAMRVTDGEAALGYSADTRFDRELVDWLAEGEMVLHETGHGPGHTALEELAELPEHVLADLRVVHVPESIDRDEVEAETDLEFARAGSRYALDEEGFVERPN